MISEQKKQLLHQFLDDLSKEQIIWSGGYFSGLVADNLRVKKSLKTDFFEVTIVYISETGNGKKIASNLVKKIKESGGKVKIKAIDQYRFSDLVTEKYFILITSTHGEGEIPESSKEFYKNLLSQSPNLSNLQYTILSLGDKNYQFFCQAGNIFEDKLQNLQAKEFLPKLDLDLDFEDFIDDWQDKVLNSLLSNKNQISISEVAKKTSKKANYQGTVLSNIVLNDDGSNKEVHHIEITAEDLQYQVGDAMAIKIGDNSPRMYSISSSVMANIDEIHLTVSRVNAGICSSYLANLKTGDKIEFYISKNNNFRLPTADKDIIMVGAGTGVAPFRGFVQQRDFDGAIGKNWLFFGGQYSNRDFLYQAEWLEYLNSGLLTKLDAAFSRDNDKKLYVQHRIKQNGDEIGRWLKDGAYFYICGDKENMAKDVEKTLIEIVGEKYLEQMKEEGRYLRDVY
jgi:sulfite reductase (NADPH) flavoprotein alpha-component